MRERKGKTQLKNMTYSVKMDGDDGCERCGVMCMSEYSCESADW